MIYIYNKIGIFATNATLIIIYATIFNKTSQINQVKIYL